VCVCVCVCVTVFDCVRPLTAVRFCWGVVGVPVHKEAAVSSFLPKLQRPAPQQQSSVSQQRPFPHLNCDTGYSQYLTTSRLQIGRDRKRSNASLVGQTAQHHLAYLFQNLKIVMYAFVCFSRTILSSAPSLARKMHRAFRN
jgi:hypothetical protein